jgi:hypothetical protein
VKSERVGFVVWLAHGGPLAFLRAKQYGAGCLLLTKHATVFSTKRQAERAIDATMAHALRNGIRSWERDDYRIRTLRTEANSR